MAKSTKAKPIKTVKPTTSDVTDVGVYPDFHERVARSFGYEAGYQQKPQSANPYTGRQAEAWQAGYDRATGTLR